jgi:hypothetical protein
MANKSKSIKKEYTGHNLWYNKQGQLHRVDGPAIEYDGDDDYENEWWFNGKRHRLDGPALRYHNGLEEWQVNGYHVRIY